MNREEKNPNILFDINATELGGNLITELHISIKVKRNNFMASLSFYWLIKILLLEECITGNQLMSMNKI